MHADFDAGEFARKQGWPDLNDDLVRDLLKILTSACRRLYGRRSARNRARRARKVMRCG